MEGPPSTPPRKSVVKRAGAHLHQRTSSKVTLLLSPPTPPHGGASSTAYRIVPESPSSPRVMSPPSKRAAPVPLAWARDAPAAKKPSGFWTRRRVVMFVGLALVVLVVVRRPTVATRAWLGRARDGEQATYGSGNGASPPRRVQASGPKGKVEPHKLYPAPPVQLAPGAAAPARGLSHKVPAKPAAAAPAHNVLAPAPPAHDLEITSATDPDTARRFLLVGWMGEQETKAQQHLYQLGLLSLALNRTLVLPTVKRSRFGTCYNHPFSLYYTEDTLARFGIPYITSDDFWAWTDRQRSAPSAQVISLNRGRLQPPDENGLTPERMCLSERSLDFGEFASKAFSSPSNDGKSAEVREQFGINVVQTLLEQERTPDTDGDVRTPAVLVTDVHLRYPFLSPSLVTRLSPFDFPSPSEYGYMDYAEHWRTLGETIASSLSPFVAVHWRTETLPVETLRPCGDALVASLEAIKREHPEIKTVYLATDYPLEVVRSSGAGSRGEEKATAHSGTMTKTLTPAHHAAMRAFLGKIEGSAFRVTTFLEEQARVTLPDELRKAVGAGGLQDLDGAIVGIVDKIVLMQAEIFYAGLPVSESDHGCAKLSQFTTQVVNARHDLVAEDSSRLWNKVGHFALPNARMQRKGGRKEA